MGIPMTSGIGTDLLFLLQQNSRTDELVVLNLMKHAKHLSNRCLGSDVHGTLTVDRRVEKVNKLVCHMASSKHGPIYCHEVCNTKRTGRIECRLMVEDVAPVEIAVKCGLVSAHPFCTRKPSLDGAAEIPATRARVVRLFFMVVHRIYSDKSAAFTC